MNASAHSGLPHCAGRPPAAQFGHDNGARLDLPLTDGSQAVYADTCTGGSGTEMCVADVERSGYPLDALRRAVLDAAARDGLNSPARYI